MFLYNECESWLLTVSEDLLQTSCCVLASNKVLKWYINVSFKCSVQAEGKEERHRGHVLCLWTQFNKWMIHYSELTVLTGTVELQDKIWASNGQREKVIKQWPFNNPWSTHTRAELSCWKSLSEETTFTLSVGYRWICRIKCSKPFIVFILFNLFGPKYLNVNGVGFCKQGKHQAQVGCGHIQQNWTTCCNCGFGTVGCRNLVFAVLMDFRILGKACDV